MRIIEILVAANALCGIAAFFIARGVIRKVRRRVLGEPLPEAPPKAELTEPK